MEKYTKRAFPSKAVFILAVGLLAASQSGNLIRIGTAHFIAIAAWRLLLAGGMMGVVAGRDFKTLKQLTKTDGVLLVAAGCMLAFHFFTWIGAVQHTTVANAAMAFSINPVFTAAAAYIFFGEAVSKRLVASIGTGILGVAVICGGDWSTAEDHVSGDLLSLLSAVLFTTYLLLGKRLQQKLLTHVYVSVVYSVAALVAFAAAPLADVEILHFDTRTWVCFVLMALIPTLIGHTSLNYSLRYFNAGHIAAATLVEPLFAGIGAYLAYGEGTSPVFLVGYAFISISVLLIALDIRKGAPVKST